VHTDVLVVQASFHHSPPSPQPSVQCTKPKYLLNLLISLTALKLFRSPKV